MNYTSQQYAQALFKTLAGKTSQERSPITKQFLVLLSRRGKLKHLGSIMREFEREELKHARVRKVLLETPESLGGKVKREVEAILGKNLYLKEKINPTLLAGIKILIDDEILIDASASSRLQKLFK